MKIFLLLILLFSTLNLFSSDFTPKIGVGYSYINNYQNLNFDSLSGAPRSNKSLKFGSNKFIDKSYSLWVQFNLTKDLNLNLDFQYLKNNLSFTNFESFYWSNAGTPDLGTFQHDIQLELKSYIFTPKIEYQFYDRLSFGVGIGLFYFISSNFTQTQSLYYPNNASSVYPTKVYNEAIPDLNNLMLSLNSGLKYQYDFSPRFGIEPKIILQRNITPLITGKAWTSTQLAGSISLYFNFPPPSPDTIEVLKKVDGITPILSKKEIISKNEYIRDTTISLSNAVDSPESIKLISTKQKYDTSYTNTTIIYENTNVEHYEKLIPKPKSILTGSLKTKFILDNNKEASVVTLKISKELVQYDLYNFNNESKIIKLKSFSDTVIFTKYPLIKFYPQFFTEAGLKNWNIIISNKSKQIKVFSGEQNIPEFVDLNLNEIIPYTNDNDLIYNFAFNLEDIENQKLEVSKGVIDFKTEDKGVASRKKNKTLILLNSAKLNDSSYQQIYNEFKTKLKYKEICVLNKNNSTIEPLETITQFFSNKNIKIKSKEIQNPKLLNITHENEMILEFEE